MRLNNKVASLDIKILKRAPGVSIPDPKSLSRRSRVGQKRYRIADAFREFMWKSVPTIEEKIEEDLLHDLYAKMDSPELKDELVQAYKRRRFHVESKGFHEVEIKPSAKEPLKVNRPNIDVSFNNMTFTSEESVGKPR